MITVIIEKTNTGFSAYTEKYPVFTTGGDIKSLKNNMVEALNLYFDNKRTVLKKQLKFKIV